MCEGEKMKETNGKEIPKTLDICGVTFHVEITDKINGDGVACEINYKDNKIYLTKKEAARYSINKVLQTLIHESLHAIDRYAIYFEADDKNTYEFCTKIRSTQLIQLFKHNPQLLRMLNHVCKYKEEYDNVLFRKE